MARLAEVIDMRVWKASKKQSRRRGLPRQRRQLRCERNVRKAVVALCRAYRRRGMSRREIARRIRLSESTLRRWELQWRRDRMDLKPRGRPPDVADRETRKEVLVMMAVLGPDVGLPTLRHEFPDVARGELRELQRHARRAYRRRRRWLVHMLHWTRAGAVWAMDFSDPPAPIDGLYPKLFCVRDLASGRQLLALPCLDKSTETVLAALRSLTRWMGAPFVLKCDNEGAFRSEEIQAWARGLGLRILYSPPHTPEYNGSIEAGIGSIKTRAHHEAARQGRPGEWTCDDVEAALQQANTTARPRGHRGPTPQEMWIDRIPIGKTERTMFQRTYRRRAMDERRERGLPWYVRLQHGEQASIDRVAIGRALIDHGFLLIRRRRVSLPNRHRKCAVIW